MLIKFLFWFESIVGFVLNCHEDLASKSRGWFGMTKCEFDPLLMPLFQPSYEPQKMDKERQAKRAWFFPSEVLSNGWALLFGLTLLNNKSRENGVSIRTKVPIS